MNILDLEKKCTGCAACADTCPVDALSVVQNENGFFVPSLNETLCVDCGKCVKVCPALDESIPETDRAFFYGWSNDPTLRAASSSGGLFSILAQKVLSDGGVVFGAVYTEDFRSVVIRSTEEASLAALRTSKYVQSNAQGAYRNMEAFLKEGKPVLFCGSPCQVAGARKYFGTRYDKLLLVDFLCGGFPSPLFYSQYIDWLQRKQHARVTGVNFRDKSNGWSKAGIRVLFENGKEYYSTPEYDPYYHYYYCTHFIRNDACMGCRFRDARYADMTIADFWGFRALSLPNDEQGMSLIITYNETGSRFFDSVKDQLTFHSIDAESGSYGFESNEKTEEELAERDAFLQKARALGFPKAACTEYCKYGKAGILFRKAKNRLTQLLKKQEYHGQ